MIHPLPTRKLPARRISITFGVRRRNYSKQLSRAAPIRPSSLYMTRNSSWRAATDIRARQAEGLRDGVDAQRLIDAVRAGDLDQTRAILRVRPELALAWHNRCTALHWAVFGRMRGIVRELIRHGANPHAGMFSHRRRDESLTIAVERGYDDITAVIREERPVTPASPQELKAALHSGDEDRVIELLERQPELAQFEAPGDGRPFFTSLRP